jgi:hypothetical protein
MDPETTELTSKLEELGETKTDEGLAETYGKLQAAAKILLRELLNQRENITSRQTCFS